jgi:hypothetical protein
MERDFEKKSDRIYLLFSLQETPSETKPKQPDGPRVVGLFWRLLFGLLDRLFFCLLYTLFSLLFLYIEDYII